MKQNLVLPRRSSVPLLVSLALMPLAVSIIAAQAGVDRCLVPPSIREPILNEISGELAQLHVQLLSANRDRQATEYQNEFLETTYLRDMAKQYGLSDVRVDFFPANRETWDGEEGDLWLIQPTRKKVASLTMVPTALARGSTSSDVEAEVVYVGQGREADYAGKDVTGKIVLGSGSVGSVFASGAQRGAVGALGTGSAGVSEDAAGYTLDQIGWATVSTTSDRKGFGFALSLRQFHELRDLLDRGQKVVMRAHVRAKTYPGRMNVTSATIPGTDPNAGELLYVAHAFETIATPGANDNCTGVATTLEAGRTLARLIRDGVLPPPRRTIRFLWGPEISGTREFIFAHPDLQDTLLAALNFDMTGANLKTTDSYLRMKMTPDSRPSYLNDLLANLLQFVDQTEIRTQQGVNAQFNYRLAPLATITSGSDHEVFNDGGIPAMQFNYWDDNFYHSSDDRIARVDPTELKRVGFMAASAFYYLANAGAPEARSLAWEATANGEKWIAEVTRQSVRLLGNDPARLHDQHKAAQNKVSWAFNRAKGSVESVQTLARDQDVVATVKMLVGTLGAARDANSRMLEATYRDRCASLGVKPTAITMTDKEREYSLMVPRRLFKVYAEEARKRESQGPGRGQAPQGRPAQDTPRGQSPRAGAATGRRLPGLASSEVANFIDGTRSILDIYNAVRAECGNLVVGRTSMKFAYVLSPEAPDIDLEAVATAIQNMEKSGTVEILKVAPKPPGRKKAGREP